MVNEQQLMTDRITIIKKLTGNNPMAYQMRWEAFNHHFSVLTTVFCYLVFLGSIIELTFDTQVLLPWDRLVTLVAFSTGPFILFSMLVLTYPLKKHIKKIEEKKSIEFSPIDNQKLSRLISIINSPIYKSLVLLPLILMMGVAIWINFEAAPISNLWSTLQIPYFLYLTTLLSITCFFRIQMMKDIE